MIFSSFRIRYLAVSGLAATAAIVSACKGPDLIAPSLATVGDTIVSVAVRAKGSKELPQGSRVVVVLVDLTKKADGHVALGGDSIPMSQPDREVRITFPADLKKIKKCGQKGVCGFMVQVVRENTVILSNANPVPYRTGQKNVLVQVEG